MGILHCELLVDTRWKLYFVKIIMASINMIFCHWNCVNSLELSKHSSASDITQAEKSWMSRLRNPKLATTVQLSWPIVAGFGLRHRDTPKFCVRVIFDIYLNIIKCISACFMTASQDQSGYCAWVHHFHQDIVIRWMGEMRWLFIIWRPGFPNSSPIFSKS